MTHETVIALLRLLSERDSISLPRVAKQLQLSTSELLRILAQLGPDELVSGLGLVEVIEGTPTLIGLTQAGREWIAANATDQSRSMGE